MNRYNLLAGVALLLLIILFPLYALREPARMTQAQQVMLEQQVREATVVYVDNCATCHGPGGEGSTIMPPLNNPALADSDPAYLYTTIARAPHGSVLTAWHIAEGSLLTSYQVEQLVTLIRLADWESVRSLALARGITIPEPATGPAPAANALLAARSRLASTVPAANSNQEGDPHQCAACHEQPPVHADRFGLDCARCHTLEAWQPALLSRHVFHLDHGDNGQIACQSCHRENYTEYTCYGCHDHTPVQMADLHEQAEVYDYEACDTCHPTGVEGKGEIAAR